MKIKSPLRLLLVAGFTFPYLAGSALAGTFTYGTFTGDANSGISNAINYTAAADFAGNGARAVNGIAFADTGPSGTNYALTGTTNPFTNFTNTVTGGSNGLLSDFRYTGNGTGDSMLTLSGLTPGNQYQTTWYNAGFGQPGARFVAITPGDTNQTVLFDENFNNSGPDPGVGNGNLLRYTFTATGTTMTYGFNPEVNGNSYHHYAFTNGTGTSAAPLPLSLATAAVTTAVNPNPGSFSPFGLPLNNDLLQTSLLSRQVGGTFAQENGIIGGLDVLTNGNFAISDIDQNNPQLTTAADNSFGKYPGL